MVKRTLSHSRQRNRPRDSVIAVKKTYGRACGGIRPLRARAKRRGAARDDRRQRSRRIVEVHGGTIWVESEGRGKGAHSASPCSFEYYGLPHTLDDPAARDAGIKGVPTAVVSADGQELGRRTPTGLGIPEQALLEILAGD